MGEGDIGQPHALNGVADRVGEIRRCVDRLQPDAQPRGGIIAGRADSGT